MLLIGAIRHTELPETRWLLEGVRLGNAHRREQWLRMREDAAKASIGGVLLLEAMLRKAGLWHDGLRLCYEPLGRPFLEGVAVDLSLSHSNTYSVCALLVGAPRHSVGVDVEDLPIRAAARERIALRWFTEEERSAYRSAPSELSFARIWTGKESLAKQTGEGLSALAQKSSLFPLANTCLKHYPLPSACVSVCVPLGCALPEEIGVWEPSLALGEV